IMLDPSPWSAVRALQVLLALGEHGRVISSDPPQSEIEAEDAQITGTMIVLVSSENSEDRLVAALNNVPELGSITVEALSAAAEVDTDSDTDATEESDTT